MENKKTEKNANSKPDALSENSVSKPVSNGKKNSSSSSSNLIALIIGISIFLIAILVIGGSVFAYFKFIKNNPFFSSSQSVETPKDKTADNLTEAALPIGEETPKDVGTAEEPLAASQGSSLNNEDNSSASDLNDSSSSSNQNNNEEDDNSADNSGSSDSHDEDNSEPETEPEPEPVPVGSYDFNSKITYMNFLVSGVDPNVIKDGDLASDQVGL